MRMISNTLYPATPFSSTDNQLERRLDVDFADDHGGMSTLTKAPEMPLAQSYGTRWQSGALQPRQHHHHTS